MPRQFAVVVAILSIAATHQADAQSSAPPVRDAGVSVVIRCQDCGTIESIREGQEARAASPPGTASASPIGLVMYIPLGRKTGTDDAYVGSVGTRQWQERAANTRYEFTVRMDDGTYRSVPRQGVSNFGVGDRVKVSQWQIEHWAP
jgi:outer membrane lipoprotein SlyB